MASENRRVWIGGLVSILMVLFAWPAVTRAADPYVWIESEQPTSTNVTGNQKERGHVDWLSDRKWLCYALDAAGVAKDVKGDSADISYTFTAPADGKYTVWNRVVLDSIRSPFSWKIDNGPWTDIPHHTATIDLREIDFFCELSWLNMGAVDLTKGSHSLSIHIPVEKNKAGQITRLIYGSDAICLSQGTWVPWGKFKPDEQIPQSPIDLAAAGQVFDLPDSKTPADRSTISLNGPWQIAAAPEHFDGDAATPLKLEYLSNDPHWQGITVPSDKNTRSELLMTHTFVYRTRLRVPASAAGRSIFVTFPSNNLNTTVFCNGVYCGFNKNPLAPFSVDLTKAVKPGQINEIEVAMRDVWYAFDKKFPDPWNHFREPLAHFNATFEHMIYPVWGYLESGILETPTVTMAGSAYVSDTFVKTSVADHQIDAQETLENPTDKPIDGQVVCEAIDDTTGKVAKAIPPTPFSLAPGAEQVVDATAAWPDAKLWWPDTPQLYTLRTTVQVAGKPMDISDQRFGFRQWTIDGIHFKLNGVIFHGWCDIHDEDTPADWLAFERATHQNMIRLIHTSWHGMTMDKAMDFMDENGIVVRKSEKLNGEACGYNPSNELIANWGDQLLQEVKSQRNHASLMIYSLENEYLYINMINFGFCDWMEPLMWKQVQRVMQEDPTHPVMTDGGGAMKAQVMPVHGDHYISGPLSAYPDFAYSENITGGGRGRWTWDMKQPRFVGEDWFITGNHPELSAIGGEAALAGKTASLPAAGKIISICQQGYRWADFGAWTFWLGPGDTDGSFYNSMSPRAVFCRQWDWSFASGAKVPRTMAIFNDTHYADPITFTWTLNIAGKQVATETSQHPVVPGTKDVFEITLPMPAVAARQEGKLELSLSASGHEVFHDTKDVSVLPTAIPSPIASGGLSVFDPTGSAVAFLKEHKIAFTELHGLKTLPAQGKTLLIGQDALSHEDAFSTKFAVWAQQGRSVIVLEQKDPLKYQALPAEMEPETNEGRTAFFEDLNSSIARGLAQKDLFTWGPDEIVYHDAYAKPESGGRSLIECGNMLRSSALAEVPVGKGMLLLSQLAIEEKLADNPVAQQLLTNLLNYAGRYQQQIRPATLTTPAGSQFGAAAAAIGLKYSPVDDPLAAIADPAEKIALITASPENLAKLADNQAKVDAFTNAGGWIIFNDLTPAGLASYNKIVGVDHLIRPFGGTPTITNYGPRNLEHITFSDPRNPLTAGIALGDIVQYSGKPIFGYTAGNFVSSDEFSYIVDYDDVAPFASSDYKYYGNITNGFTAPDGWPLIINAPLNKDGSPYSIDIHLPRPETVKEFTFIGNNSYWSVTKINLLFDGKDPASYDVHSDSQPNVLAVNPPRKASTVTLQLTAWTPKVGSADCYGIDNISIGVERSPDFLAKVKPMLNIGGMMEYPHGKGGIILCNLLFLPHEEVPVNLQKKQAILADLLRNLDAPFAGKTVIVGSHLAYTPIDISKQANQYRTDRGWFGNPKFTFTDLPTGDQTFAGVKFNIYDFATSPVPTCISLGGPNVPHNLPDEVDNIPVNRKADALFFLQTARVDHGREAAEIQQHKKIELYHYLIHYADGQTIAVPVYLDWNVADYRQASPSSLPGGALAWSAEYPGGKFSAAAWTQQWNNPRPGEPVASIDIAYSGRNHRAVPALLAITAASADSP